MTDDAVIIATLAHQIVTDWLAPYDWQSSYVTLANVRADVFRDMLGHGYLIPVDVGKVICFANPSMLHSAWELAVTQWQAA